MRKEKMVDLSHIKKIYAAMSDEELQHFVKSEGGNLTDEAFQLLKSELSSRRISTDTIARIEDGSYLAETAHVKRVIKAVPDQLSITALSMALNEKCDGKTNDEIILSLDGART